MNNTQTDEARANGFQTVEAYEYHLQTGGKRQTVEQVTARRERRNAKRLARDENQAATGETPEVSRRIGQNEFAILCEGEGVHPAIALENEEVREAIRTNSGLNEIRQLIQTVF